VVGVKLAHRADSTPVILRSINWPVPFCDYILLTIYRRGSVAWVLYKSRRSSSNRGVAGDGERLERSWSRDRTRVCGIPEDEGIPRVRGGFSGQETGQATAPSVRDKFGLKIKACTGDLERPAYSIVRSANEAVLSPTGRWRRAPVTSPADSPKDKFTGSDGHHRQEPLVGWHQSIRPNSSNCSMPDFLKHAEG